MTHLDFRHKRGEYGKSADKALEKWERKFLERTIVDELVILYYHLYTYGGLRLGEGIQCNIKWIETPLDEEHRDKLLIRIPKEEVDTFKKFHNPHAKEMWTCKNKDKKERCMIIFNPVSVQVIKQFYNKHRYGICEHFPKAKNIRTIERSVQRAIEKLVKPLQEERRRMLKNSGQNLTEEEIEQRVLQEREKLSPHCLRSTCENYLINERRITTYHAAQMLGHSEKVQKQHYLNAKDLLESTSQKIPQR